MKKYMAAVFITLATTATAFADCGYNLGSESGYGMYEGPGYSERSGMYMQGRTSPYGYGGYSSRVRDDVIANPAGRDDYRQFSGEYYRDYKADRAAAERRDSADVNKKYSSSDGNRDDLNRNNPDYSDY